MKKKIKFGEFEYESTNNLWVMRWLDKKELWMLSIVHSAEMTKSTDKLSHRIT
jgi:hypothetical protein